MRPPTTIDEVLADLDTLIARERAKGSPLVYFPVLYRRVTAEVQDAIDRGDFEDGARMERFDVLFARLYLEADRAETTGGQPPRSWQAAFAAEQNHRLIVLQHLLLGMNAHISFDLGRAACAAAGDDLLSLKRDFHHINRILGSLLDDTQRRLTRIFDPLGLIDRLLGSIDERLSIFSLHYARDAAWTQALELHLADAKTREDLLEARDTAVAAFSAKILRPPSRRARLLLLAVRSLEKGDVRWRADCLR